jgi:hypothetical protein
VMVTRRYVSSSHHVFHKPIRELCYDTLIGIQVALQSTTMNCLSTILWFNWRINFEVCTVRCA